MRESPQTPGNLAQDSGLGFGLALRKRVHTQPTCHKRLGAPRTCPRSTYKSNVRNSSSIFNVGTTRALYVRVRDVTRAADARVQTRAGLDTPRNVRTTNYAPCDY